MNFINTLKQKWKSLNNAWRFSIGIFLLIRVFYATWSWIILTVQPIAVHYVDVNNQPAVIFLNLHTIEQNTYLRNTNGAELDFRSAGRSTVKDLQTGSAWDIQSGLAIDGYFKGTSLTPAPTPTGMFPYLRLQPYPNAWLGLWQRFDTNWYIAIAENGYGSTAGDDHFPPLYPLLIRLITPLFGNAFIAGLIISHIATLFVIKLLVDLFDQWNPYAKGRETVFYFLIYPTSFFLFSAYSESLFLVLTLLSFRSMKKQDWLWSGFWIFCATLTRLQGVALGIPMLYLIWEDRPFLRKFSQWVGLAIAGAGILFYFILRAVVSTDAIVPVTESAWPTQLVFPWQTYWYAIQIIISNNSNYIDILNLTVSVLMLILVITGWKKLPLEYNLYTAFSLLIVTSRIVENQPLSGMLRFSLTLFPVFYTINLRGENPLVRRLIIYTSLAFSLYLSSDFFSWAWVA